MRLDRITRSPRPTTVEGVFLPALERPLQAVTIHPMTRGEDLHGHVSLVTGAGQRLGRAFAEALARAGSDVAVHFGEEASGADGAVEVARSLGVRAQALQADLTDPQATRDLVRNACDAFGVVDILVNSAAIFEPVGVSDCSLEIWQAHMAVNLTAPFLLSQAFGRRRDGGAGSIVNILDWRALRPGSDHFAYTVSKAALAAMTLSLAQGLAPSIRVNGLALGAILPPPGLVGKTDAPIDRLPVGRWGEVEEACQALVFLLAGPQYITGQVLHVDGGRHLL